VNEGIEERLSALSADRWMSVKLDDLGGQVDGLFRFLGLPPHRAHMVRKNEANYAVKPWKEWNMTEQAMFERHCAVGMRRWYPDWKSADGEWQATGAH
jgi:hypothetical protein